MRLAPLVVGTGEMMQVNVTVSINGPSGEELSVVIGPETAYLTLNEAASIEVPLAELRQFVAALDRMVGDAS